MREGPLDFWKGLLYAIPIAAACWLVVIGIITGVGYLLSWLIAVLP